MKLNSLAPILEKIPFSLLLVLYLADLGWDYYGFKYQDGGQILQKQVEIQASEEEIRKLETRVEQTKQFLKTLDSKRSEMRRISQELEGSRSVLSDTLDVPQLMTLVLTEAKRTGMIVISLKPGSMSQKEFYSEQTFDLAFKGGYIQTVAFLDRVSNLQKIIRVDNFEFGRSKESPAKLAELTGTIQLKAYKYNTSKADETAAVKPGQPDAPKTAKKGAGA